MVAVPIVGGGNAVFTFNEPIAELDPLLLVAISVYVYSYMLI
jgi:hypothetical protein